MNERIEVTEQAILYLNSQINDLWRVAKISTVAIVVLALACIVAIGSLHAQEVFIEGKRVCTPDWHEFLREHPGERVIFTGTDQNNQPVFKILAQPNGGTWRLIVLAAAEESKISCIITSGATWIGPLKPLP